MHSVHTHGPGCAHRPCALRPGRPCRGHVVSLCLTVSWLVVGRVAGLASASRAQRSVSCRCCAVSQRVVAVSQRLARYITTQGCPPLSHDTIFVSRPFASQATRVLSLPHALAPDRPYRGPCLGRIAGLPWPYRKQAWPAEF